MRIVVAEFPTSWDMRGDVSFSFASVWVYAARYDDFSMSLYNRDLSPREADTVYEFGFETTHVTDATPPSPPATNIDFAIFGGMYADVYNRLWITPTQIEFVNPSIGDFSTFNIWNANPVDVQIKSIGGTKLFAAPVVDVNDVIFAGTERPFDALFFRKVGMDLVQTNTFYPNEGPPADASFIVVQDSGSIVQDLLDISVEGMKETYKWRTDIITSRNGTENRIATRVKPRITMEVTSEQNDLYELLTGLGRLMSGLESSLSVPLWHKTAPLKAPIASGDTTISFNRNVADLRVGDRFLVTSPVGERDGGLYTVTKLIDGDTVQFSPASTLDGDVGTLIVVPIFSGRMSDNPRMSASTVVGDSTVVIENENPNLPTLRRPFASSYVELLDDHPVLDKIASAEANEMSVMNNAEVLDFDVGLTKKEGGWTLPKMTISRQYSYDRVSNTHENDFWKEFMGLIDGSRNPFYIPLSVPKLTGISSSNFNIGANQVFVGFYVEFNPYLKMFRRNGAFTKVKVTMADGSTFYSRVVCAENSTFLTFESPVYIPVTGFDGPTPLFPDIVEVEIMALVRLLNDEITFIHTDGETIVNLAVSTEFVIDNNIIIGEGGGG